MPTSVSDFMAQRGQSGPGSTSVSDFMAQRQPNGPNQPAGSSTPSTWDTVKNWAEDLATGAGKGFLHTVSSFGAGRPSYMSGGGLYNPAEQHEAPPEITTPSNQRQQIGYGVEQAGEFLVPAMGDEKLATNIAELAPRALRRIAHPVARIGVPAITSGTLNSMQGGSFATGAAMGAGGAAVGEGLKALGPKLAESAIGIRRTDRAYSKTPGNAIINETSGFTPGALARSAQQKIGQLTPQLEAAADASPNMASLRPARTVANDAIAKAQGRNAVRTATQTAPMQTHLTTHAATGLPLAEQQTPRGILELKRGFNDDFLHNWNPDTAPGVTKTGRQIYHALDQEFDKAVPDGADLNQRISSLIPVAKRADSVARGEGLSQRVMGRVGARTGALIGATGGGVAGYREGGVPGAVGGALTGLVVPELIASPTAQIAAARTLASPITRKGVLPLVKGAALQARPRPLMPVPGQQTVAPIQIRRAQ